ncbi:phage tail protein [Halalkalibacterium halodurans]|uniref:phage tail protein n=1 Tax=Halalkalibacterium halodurans TaxID=86665 RepID=UPI002AA9DA95|nr:phage tail protein [Halalkalibacterium halodurans]MDY7224595.1 phage tail protein [Halalkalibacterium halodurans]MDY7239757.1 phage tail protein [Halalkalibacterium halodurans]MED4123472.1 phage tail protein [Halalkalibacterium halodurans]MED4172658.1 phage tail protein [Halalkalibacterium halodurans]
MYSYNQLRRVTFNQLGRIAYNSRSSPRRRAVFERLAGARPVVLTQERERLAVLDHANDIILEQEINGIDTVTFNIPFSDEKNQFIQNEHLIQIIDDYYIIRKITHSRGSQGVPITEVYAEALWYDLQFAEPMDISEWEGRAPAIVMADILRGTDWSVGRVELMNVRNVSVEPGVTNRLAALSQLPEVYGGELHFNSEAMTVDFLAPVGRQSGAAIVYEKNIHSIEAIYDTEDLITRIYPYGKENLSIEDINDGVPYLDIRDDPSYEFTDKLRVRILKDDRFTNPFHLREMAEEALKVLSQPRTSYHIKAADLSEMAGMSHEQFFLGDEVRVYDKELGIDIATRIMAWQYNVAEPWNTEIMLESKQPTLSDLLTGIQEGTGFLQSEDTVDSSDMLELSVFNHILNSRADDGFHYWTNSGWEIDAVNGYSGNASFKATGTIGRKVLSQTVYPAHRDHYAISFRSATKEFQTNDGGRVGLEIIVRYDDGTEDEPTFISLT